VVEFSVLQIAFTRKKDFGKEERELKWARAQRTLHGLHPPETKMFGERTTHSELNQMAEEAKRRAEIARYNFHRCCNEMMMPFCKICPRLLRLHVICIFLRSSY
jgi:hypothetical protein